MPPRGRLGSVTGVTVTAAPTTEPFPFSGCTSIEDERLHRKQRLAAAFRIFSRYGFDEGVAGHITARDPEHADRFWVNRLGQDFSTIKASSITRARSSRGRDRSTGPPSPSTPGSTPPAPT